MLKSSTIHNFNTTFGYLKANFRPQAIMPTHPYEARITHILKPSPACQNSYLFTYISPLSTLSISDDWWTLSALQATLTFGKLPLETVATLIKTLNIMKYHLQNDLCDFYYLFFFLLRWLMWLI